ncbi:MAG: type II toxin-antitoxin system VapC family toxin [Bacteroidota bacterium]
MTKYLLDTDICILYLKGKYSLAQKCESVRYENCYVSAVTIGELLFGAHNSDNYEKHRDDAQQVMQLATVLPIFDSLNVYGKEKARLRKAGTPIPEFDLLIGTTAVHHGMVLVTNNTKHMARIEGIRLENWTRVEDSVFGGLGVHWLVGQ